MTDPCAPTISVIIPVYNGEGWIDHCFESIINQDILEWEAVEISVYDDSSTDNTSSLLMKWKKKLLKHKKISLVITRANNGKPRGVGYAKNQAVKQSKGSYLCFQDIDDIMLPSRIRKQFEVAKKFKEAIVGCKVKRIPENSTQRFISWANNLPQSLLTLQIYTSHGPTVLMPTWFFHRSVFDRVGGFSIKGKGTPEDLIFFYQHLDNNGMVARVDEILVLYRYHVQCTTFSVSEDAIWDVRLRRLEDVILPNWTTFTIWNAGKQGRKLYRSLKPENRRKVAQFCDVDAKKTGKYYEPYCKLVGGVKRKIEIVHFAQAKPPFVICVKLDLTGGEFERNLNSLNLKEGNKMFRDSCSSNTTSNHRQMSVRNILAILMMSILVLVF